MQSDNPKPRRRRLQFSLWTLLVVVTILAVPLGLLAWLERVKNEQIAMRRWVENRGGAVMLFRTKHLVRLPPDATDEEREKVMRVFPEAEVFFPD